MCFFLVCLILQDFFDRLFLGQLFAFLCAGCGFPYPIADVPQLLQILLYLGQRYFQLCDFAEKLKILLYLGQRYFQFCDFAEKCFLLLLQLLLGAVLIVRVLGKVGGGFLLPGDLRVFLFEFLLCFLEKYLLVFLIDGLTFFAVCPAGKNPVNHFAAGFVWLARIPSITLLRASFGFI